MVIGAEQCAARVRTRCIRPPPQGLAWPIIPVADMAVKIVIVLSMESPFDFIKSCQATDAVTLTSPTLIRGAEVQSEQARRIVRAAFGDRLP